MCRSSLPSARAAPVAGGWPWLGYVGKRPRTWLSLTGREAFDAHVAACNTVGGASGWQFADAFPTGQHPC